MACATLDLDDVPDSAEFRRILGLPRRAPSAPDGLAERLTRALALHPCPYPGTLHHVQAAALYEAWKEGGLLAPLRVGAGKTLLCFLLPVVMKAERAVVVAPAALEQDYQREFSRLAMHWRHRSLTFVSYERLSSKSNGTLRDSKGEVMQRELLERLAPDLLIFDEVHKLKNHGAVCTKRVKRYLASHPNTKVAATSGSLTRRSVKEFAHIAEWTLRSRSPLPRTFTDLEAWASALDEADNLAPRAGVGALRKFLPPGTRPTLSLVRAAVQRRLVETPGVVGTQDGPLAIPLLVREVAPLREDPAINAAFESVRLRWELPVSGMPIADGLELARQAKTIGCGYFLDYRPRPPEQWTEARREWAGYCRDIVRWNRSGIDSEALVKEHVRTGLLQDSGLLAAWERVCPLYVMEDHAVVEWLSEESIETAATWVERNRGIVWTGNIALGLALEKRLHIPFYGAEGKTQSGAFILDHRPGFPMIASKQANGTGRNLQHGWSTNLFFTTPSEQVIGRTHRPGQEGERVTCDVFIGCAEHVLSFESEVSNALYAQEITGDAQRLVYADKTLPSAKEVMSRPGYRWAK